MVGFFKRKTPLDILIESVYGENPPKPSANINESVNLAYKMLLSEQITLDKVYLLANQLYSSGIPYNTYDLALCVALSFFKDSENKARLFNAQLLARVSLLQWVIEKKCNPKIAAAFEDTLYNQFKDSEQNPNESLLPLGIKDYHDILIKNEEHEQVSSINQYDKITKKSEAEVAEKFPSYLIDLKNGMQINDKVALRIAVTGACIAAIFTLVKGRDAFVVFWAAVMGAILPLMLMVLISLLVSPFFRFRQERREGKSKLHSMVQGGKPLFLFSLFVFVFYFLNHFLVVDNIDKQNQIYQKSDNEIIQPIKPVYLRPLAAPNGQAWPKSAGYVKGFKKLHTDGLSKITVDNSQNNSDVFVKLVAISELKSYPVRVFFVPAFNLFTISNIRAGSYDIRYRDLDSGSLSRSEPFTLQEIETYDGVQYSNITMTLYKIQNGNMQTYGLSENEF